MKRGLILLMVGLLHGTPAAAGTITFEGIVGPGERLFSDQRPSPQTIGDGVEHYLFSLSSSAEEWSFEDSACLPVGVLPRNGTDTMSVFGFVHSTITIQKQGGGSFSLNAIDLAVWAGSSAPTVRVTSGALSRDLLPGIAFSTFSFPAEWAGLTSVSLTTVDGSGNWSLDNVVLNAPAVPEPASLLLFGTGVFGMRAWRRRRR